MMKNLKIDRNLEEGMNIQINNISFTPERGNQIDEAIYYLICAQEKLKSDNIIENYLAEPRIELAIITLNKFLLQNPQTIKHEETNEKF